MAGANDRRPRPHLTPSLTLRDCARAIEFYKRAFGAVEVRRMPSPDGKTIWHAELRFGDAALFLGDEMPGMGKPAPRPGDSVPVNFWLQADDCDAAYQKALAAGGTSTMEPADMFWGDRCAGVDDPFGYNWNFAEHRKDLTDEEIRRAGEEFARGMAAQGGVEAGAGAPA